MIKKRTLTLTTGTSHVGAGAVTGEARGEVGLGAKYARILKIEVKGDDTNVDSSASWVFSDDEGRIITTLAAFDAGPDDSTVKATEQTYSTVGRALYPTALETDIVDTGGDFAANTEGGGHPVIARSPLLVTNTSGTDGDVHRIHVFVEV